MPELRPEIIAVMPFEKGAHVATAFRAGSAFLVGDAAHRTTPEGGVGMNTAIHGAHNLGWKLAWTLRGHAGDAPLDSYQAEREPVGRPTRAGRCTATVTPRWTGYPSTWACAIPRPC